MNCPSRDWQLSISWIQNFPSLLIFAFLLLSYLYFFSYSYLYFFSYSYFSGLAVEHILNSKFSFSSQWRWWWILILDPGSWSWIQNSLLSDDNDGGSWWFIHLGKVSLCLFTNVLPINQTKITKGRPVVFYFNQFTARGEKKSAREDDSPHGGAFDLKVRTHWREGKTLFGRKGRQTLFGKGWRIGLSKRNRGFERCNCFLSNWKIKEREKRGPL